MPFFWSEWYQAGASPASGAAGPASGTLGGPWRRLGPETCLPTWTLARWGASGLLYGILQTVAETAVPAIRQLGRAGRAGLLSTLDLDDSRLEWRLPKSLPHPTDLTVTVSAASLDGPVGGTVRPAISAYDYRWSPDPVWWWDPETGQIRLRNLFMKGLQQQDGRGVYTIPGESRALVPDAGLYYRRHPSQEWECLSAESGLVSGTSFSLPVSGTWLIEYGSLSALEAFQTAGTATLAWPGGNTIPLPLVAGLPNNHLDAWGRLLQVTRLQREDDRAYKRRMLLEVAAPPDATLPGVTRGIASGIGALTGATWDGVSTLSLDAGGTRNITAVAIPQLSELRSVSEVLTAVSGGTQYVATLSNWRPGWQVLAGGVPVQDAAVSGNVVTLGTAVSGSVTARYSVRQWSLSRGSSGQIVAINPGMGVPSGGYLVLTSRDVRLSVLDLPGTRRDRLLTASGSATALFTGVALQLALASRTLFGRSRWGGATWLTPAEVTAATAHLPLLFDTHSVGPSGFLH